MVIAPQDVARSKEFFCGMVIKVVTGNRYLGGFIRESEAEKIWLARKVAEWAESVESLAGVSHKHP